MTYDELDEDTQAKARERVRQMESEDWRGSDYCEPQLAQILGALGFDLDTVTEHVRAGAGGVRVSVRPAFEWTGFYSQGDGFRFFGTWYADSMDTGKLMAEYPSWHALHKLCLQGTALMLRQPKGRITMRRESYGAGLSYVALDVPDIDDEEGGYCDDAMQDDFKEWTEQLNKLCFDYLQEDYEDRCSDESALSMIEANEWEFNEEGELI